MFVQVVSLCELIKQTLPTEAEIDLPDNVSKEIFLIKKYVSVKTPVSVESPPKPPLLKHGDFIVLLNNEFETSDDTSKDPLHPHDASDLEKKNCKM